MLKKILKIVGIAAAIIMALAVLFFSFVYYKIGKGDLVKWDGQWYTKEELAAMFPPQEYNAPAKNTPEEVYADFRQALLDNDIEKALRFIREEKRDEYKQAFEDEVKLGKWVKSLPKSIGNPRTENNFAYYDWDKGDGYKHTIDFTKNKDGYWEIDSI